MMSLFDKHVFSLLVTSDDKCICLWYKVVYQSNCGVNFPKLHALWLCIVHKQGENVALDWATLNMICSGVLHCCL